MIKDYAFSTSALGYYLNQRHIEAFAEASMRNIEFGIAYCLEGTPESNETRLTLEKLFAAGTAHAASIHLPYGHHCDMAVTDEHKRREAVEYTANMIREARKIVHAPEMTLHASAEPVEPSQRAARIAAARKSISELMPEVIESDSRVNVELLPRSCIGNCEEELLEITEGFDPARVGINLDVNHVMTRYRELPQIATKLIDRINVCHFSDYDGVDEQHWGIPHTGVIDWRPLMDVLQRSPRNITIIFEWSWLLRGRRTIPADPIIQIRALEYARFYLSHPELFKESDAAFAKAL